MSDLINRSSLIEELNAWAMQCKSIAEISILGAVVNIIENQPTAYNVDKVVEQLADEILCDGCSGCTNCFELNKRSECGSYKAIEKIVKAGVVE